MISIGFQVGNNLLRLDKLKVIWVRFSTLSLAVFAKSAIASHIQTRTLLELKTMLHICPGASWYFSIQTSNPKQEFNRG